MAGAWLWSTTAASNATADGTVNWSEGQAPSTVNDSARAMMASFARWRDDLSGATATTGAVAPCTAYSLTTNQSFTSYVDKAEIAFSPHADCGATVTINVDGLGAKALRSAASVELAAGALKSGGSYRARYRSAGNEFILLDFYSAPISAGALTTTMYADASVTYAKIQNVAASKLLGNPTGSGAAPSEVSIGGNLFFSGTTLKGGMSRGGIDGCIISNNAGDATNSIDVAAGVCRDSTNAVDITVSALTAKALNSNWAAGSSAGMRNSGAAITNTTYHIYAVAKADGTQDIYAHTSTTVATVITALQAETGGASYVYARRIGSIVRAGGTILGFVQDGDYFALKSPVLDISNATPGTSANTATLASVPIGVRVRANITGYINNSASKMYVSDLSQTDLAPSLSAAPLFNVGDGTGGASSRTLDVWTNTSAQIRYRVDTNQQTYITSNGWNDPRGKNS